MTTGLPFPEPTNVTNMLALFQHANVLTGNLLGVFILAMIGVVTFVATKNYSYERAFAYSAFTCLIVSIMLIFLDMIPFFVLFLCICLMIGAIIVLWREREREEGN